LDNSNGGMGGKTVLITGGTSGIGKATAVALRSPEQGADTLIWLASSPEVDGVSGKDFFDRKEIEAKKVAHDPAACRALWEISEDLTGLKVAA
jgi:NAD(P)-dependent dehydrogenase (short-subunit alcohol dehydrogenase family)